MLYLEVFFVLLLTVLNGVLPMSELALVSSRRSRLGPLAAQGSGGARTALRLMDHPGRLPPTVQTAITLGGILPDAFGRATMAHHPAAWLHPSPFQAPTVASIHHAGDASL